MPRRKLEQGKEEGRLRQEQGGQGPSNPKEGRRLGRASGGGTSSAKSWGASLAGAERETGA